MPHPCLARCVHGRSFASVVCMEEGRLWALDRLTFRKLALGTNIAQGMTSVNSSSVMGEEDDEEAAREGEAREDEAREGNQDDAARDEPPLTTRRPNQLPPIIISSSSTDDVGHDIIEGDGKEEQQAAGVVASTESRHNGKTTSPSRELFTPEPTASKAKQLWQRAAGLHIVNFNFESFEQRQIRKKLRQLPALHKLFEDMWMASDTQHTRCEAHCRVYARIRASGTPPVCGMAHTRCIAMLHAPRAD